MRGLLRVLLSAAAAMMIAGAALADPPAAKPPVPWQINIVQIDRAGTMVGNPHPISCLPEGCQTTLPLDVVGKSDPFLVVVTFVENGAYLTVRAMAPEVGKVIGFEEGYEGPIFIRLRPTGGGETLRFTLTGPAVSAADQGMTQLMQSSESLVFHRRMEPDMTLKIDFSRPSLDSTKNG